MELSTPVAQRFVEVTGRKHRDRGAQQGRQGRRALRRMLHAQGTEFDQALHAATRQVRVPQLFDIEFRAMRVAGHVDQQVAEDPIDEPGRWHSVALCNLCESKL